MHKSISSNACYRPWSGFQQQISGTRARGAYPDIATNVGIRGRSAGLRPGGSGAGPGNAAGPEAGAPVAVSDAHRDMGQPRGTLTLSERMFSLTTIKP